MYVSSFKQEGQNFTRDIKLNEPSGFQPRTTAFNGFPIRVWTVWTLLQNTLMPLKLKH